jgi:hypothetical protein
MSRVLAFIDDSINPGAMACGARVVAAAALASAKGGVGVDSAVPIHSRVLFSGAARKRSPWAAVDPARIATMLENLCDQLFAITEQAIVAAAPMDYPSAVAAPDVVTEMNERSLSSTLYGAVQVRLRERYGDGGFETIIDPDTTQIPFGSSNRRADRTRGIFVAIGPGNEPVRLDPVVAERPKPVLLEIADLYAWCTARAYGGGGGRQTSWASALIVERVKAERLVMEWNAEADAGWRHRGHMFVRPLGRSSTR